MKILIRKDTAKLDQNYEAGKKALDKALFNYHPDRNGDTQENLDMTRKLIATRDRWTQLWRWLRDE